MFLMWEVFHPYQRLFKEWEDCTMKERLAGIFLWLYFIAGGIGIVTLITRLIPVKSQLITDVLCILVPSLFGYFYHKYVVLPEQSTQNQLNQAKRQTAELEEAIKKAIIRETTVDLYAYCDPGWARHIQGIKQEAQDRRAYQEYVEGLSQSEPPHDTDSPRA